METPKRYEIDSFDKLLNVANKENVERLAVDLAGWLLYITDVIEKYKEHHPEAKGKLNSEIVKCHFIWIDDSKHDLKGVNLTNINTGEVTEIKFDKNKNK
jgi:hypothetical protein